MHAPNNDCHNLPIANIILEIGKSTQDYNRPERDVSRELQEHKEQSSFLELDDL